MLERQIRLALAVFAVGSVLSGLALSGCGSKADPALDPISPQTVSVSETLRVPLTVTNPDGVAITGFRFEAPDLEDLPGFSRSAGISGTTGGGEFRFTPLASHVGTFDITFIMTWSGGEDRQSTVIEVEPAANTAPVFLRPGAGGTYDLTRNPCVDFDIEVRDDDSTNVQINSRVDLPQGATLYDGGNKTGNFHWCPTPDQVSSSLRYTIAIEAADEDDGHAPTEKDYIVVLRGTARPDCPGDAPTISVTAPSDGGSVTYNGGFAVTVNASDDMGLRDAPLLYYTTTEPEDISNPDVTSFSQIAFAPGSSGTFSARVPSLGLEEGDEAQVWIVASAIDNDDTTGTSCDHQTDTAVLSFTAVGASAASNGAACDACGASTECSSGICASAAGGAQCLDSCAGGESCASGSCVSVTSVDGAVTMACGDVAAACTTTSECTNDSHEPNNDITQATELSGSSSGQICPLDADYYSVSATAGTRVSFTVDGFTSEDGDLDLEIVNAGGTIVASSAGTDDSETAGYCLNTGATIYARVVGYRLAANSYSISTTSAACAACSDDSGENDDTFATARNLTGTDGDRLFDGTICPADDDFIGFDVTTAGAVRIELATEGAGDLDIELLGTTGRIAISEEAGGDELIVQTLAAGHYVVHVYGFDDASGDYVGSINTTATTTCASTDDCPLDTVCNASRCVSDVCTSTSMCPSGHICPVAGPGSAVRHCAPDCDTNNDCREPSTQACKRFAEGHGCGRRGSAPNGAACASFSDCGGQRSCMPYPSGYCARAGCTTNSECEAGTYCGTVSGVGVCVLDCTSTPSVCRSGYTCSTLSDAAGASRHACVPAMSGG
jgi:hypothetical protein